MVELYINGLLVDLGDAKIQSTYAIAKIGEIGSRSGSRSGSFDLPKTAKNRAIFENPDDVNNLSNIPYQRLDARLFNDGVDLLVEFAIITATKESYSINLYGVESDLYSELKGGSIRDIDLNEYNHHWSNDFIALSNSPTSPVQYLVADYQTDSPNGSMNTVDSSVYFGVCLPSVNENFLIEKIINEAGYTVDNQLLQTDMLLDVVPFIPCGGEAYERDLDFSRLLGVFDLSPIPTGSPTGLQYDCNSITSQPQAYWQQFFNSNTNFGGSFIIPDEAIIEYKMDIDLWNDGGVAELIYIDVYSTNTVAGSALIRTYAINVPITGTPPNAPYNFTVTDTVECVIPTVGYCGFGFIVRSASGSNVFNSVGDNYFEILSAKQRVDSRLRPIDFDRTIGYEAASNTTFVYDYVTVAHNLPDIAKDEFLKQYLTKFNAIATVDAGTKLVTITPFNRLSNNIADCFDWSNKLDLSEAPELRFDLGYSKNNHLKYGYDEDVIKPDGTDYNIEVDIEYAPTKALPIAMA